MMEYIGDHGELLQGAPDDGQSPYREACRKLVAFKLKVLETAAADPKLHSAPCVQALIVYLSFLKIDKKTFRPTSVYASTLTLMARGGIKSDRTARNARTLLLSNGYLAETKTATKDGCVRFQVANPRADVVKMHIREATEYLKEKDAERKKDDRAKRPVKTDVPVVSTTPPKPCPGRKYGDVLVETTSKYHREYLGDIISEGEETLIAPSPAYAFIREDDPSLPFPVPSSDEEADGMLAAMTAGYEVGHPVVSTIRMFLNHGTLTPDRLDRMLREPERVAA